MIYNLDLSYYHLTELTEEDLTALCKLNNFKLEQLKVLGLYKNNLTNLDFITENIFLNLKTLSLGFNKITDISNIKYLTNLEKLSITGLNLKDEHKTIEMLQNMNNLKEMWCYDTFKKYNYKQLETLLTNIELK